MLAFEYILLGLTYTTLCISLFLQWVCYRRNIESLETIAFTASLLLLIISISLSPLFPEGETSNISILIAMVLVSVCTFLNTWVERKHTINEAYKKTHLGIATILIVSILISYYSGHLKIAQYAVVSFLIGTIIWALGFSRYSRPVKRYQHIEKANRIFSIAFLIIVPTYLVLHYAFENEFNQFSIGFLMYIAFTVMALHKIYDDLQRLSLTNTKLAPQEQHFKNYGLTKREEDIARLIIQGQTNQSISEQLFISLPTVKTHASNIYKKCNVKTRHALTILLNT